MNKQIEIRKMSMKEWTKEGENRFGTDKKKWKFKCVNCKNIQSIQDFINLGVKNPQDYVYFSCIGRFKENTKGTLSNKSKPCNYTLGGLFNFSKLQVIGTDDKPHSVFEFAEVKK